jgi:WD40 repeat protein
MTLVRRTIMSWSVQGLGLVLGASACLSAVVGVEIGTRPERRATYAVAFSPRGDRVAAVSESVPGRVGRLWVWDVSSGRPIASTAVADRPMSVAFAPDGSALAIGGWNGTVAIRDPVAGRVLRSFDGHSTPVRGLAFLPDGRSIVAGASDGRVIQWDVSSGRTLREFERGRRYPVNALAVSRDGRYLAAAGGMGAGALGLWKLETSDALHPTSTTGFGEPIAFAPDRAVLAVRAANPAMGVSLIDLDGDRPIARVPAASARGLAFSPDGHRLATGATTRP